MGKFVYSIMMVFIIELALYIFAGTTYGNTSIFNFIFNPSAVSTLYLFIYGAIIGFATIGIVASSFFSLNIYGMYASICAVLITYAMSIMHLWSFIYGTLADRLGECTTGVCFPQVITVMIIAPFLITYLIAAAEWVRSN
jgi:hypothetical protein